MNGSAISKVNGIGINNRDGNGNGTKIYGSGNWRGNGTNNYGSGSGNGHESGNWSGTNNYGIGNGNGSGNINESSRLAQLYHGSRQGQSLNS